MASVDDLCRSYLDLKYHFDPAAASAAGLVSHDSRLGRFDTGTVRGASLRPAVGRGRGRGAGERRPAGGDRPHRASGRDSQRDLPAGARAAPRAQPGLLAVARLPGALRDARAAERRRWPSARRRRSSGSEPSPRSSTRRATRSTSRPPCSWTPRSACSAAGASWWCSWSPRSSRSRPSCAPISRRRRGRRWRRSSASAPRSGTRSSPPPTRTRSRWERSSSAAGSTTSTR